MLRFIANLIGFGLYTLLGHTILAMVIVVLSGSAVPGSRPIDRVFAAMIGCICALLVGFLFNKLTRLLFPVLKKMVPHSSQSID